jgi:uncharacterized membrane protein
MKRSFMLMFFLAAAGILPSVAQNRDSIAIRRYYEENTIFWMGQNRYYKNNQSYPIKNLKEEFKFSKDASWEYDLYRKSSSKALIGLLATEVLAISSIIVKDRNTKIALLAGSIVTLAISIPLSAKARKHFHRSIYYYNRDILLR